tara:strand:- start:3211 stop:3462 length:252 start_codon:yes stop_codon:yes gene_type:complete
MTDPILIDKINLALADIRPYLEADGGDIELVEVTDDLTVKVKFLGACKSCTMSAMTLKGGVEEAIKNTIPEIKAVIAVEEILS